MNQPERRLRDGVTPGSTVILPRTSRIRKLVGPPQTSKSRRWVWVLLGILIPVVAFVVQLNAIARAVVANDPRIDRPSGVNSEGFTVLLVGVDERAGDEGDGVRSDTLVLLRVNPRAGRMSLLSIPRDTRVDVRGRGQGKINSAYAYGYLHPNDLYAGGVSQQESGMALAAETVESFTGIRQYGYRVDYMTQLNFAGFSALVDALGGITVDVPKRIVDNAYPTADYGVMRIEFVQGIQRMTGDQALIYARTRHADNDFGRNQRQQQVIQAILAEMRQRGPFGLISLFNQAPEILGGTFKTTMPLNNPVMTSALFMTFINLEVADIAQFRMAPDSIERYTVDGSDILWDPVGVNALVELWLVSAGASTTATTASISGDVFNQFVSDTTKTWDDIQTQARTLLGFSQTESVARIQVFNGARVGGLARRVSDQLAAVGFTTDVPGDAPALVTDTIIYDVNGHPQQAAQIAKIIPGRVVTGPPPATIQSSADIVVVVGSDNVNP